MNANPTAAVLIIGNEILSGRTHDVNLRTIAAKLIAIGIKLAEARVVQDIEADIVAAVQALGGRYDHVFTTGGIGPTHDDITAASMAKAFGVALIEHPEARRRLEAHYGAADLSDARLRMARVPAGATLIDNRVSAAPGFHIGNVYVMAGIPKIMQAMLDAVIDSLPHGPKIHTASVSGHVPESVLADERARLAAAWPQLDIGSYPSFKAGQIHLVLIIRGTDLDAVRTATAGIQALVASHGGEPVVEDPA